MKMQFAASDDSLNVDITAPARSSSIVIPTSPPDVPGTGDLGRAFVRLQTANGQTVSELQARPKDSRYDFRFTNVSPGQYLLSAGTDNDRDVQLCDTGEACGVFPPRDTPTVLVIDDESVANVNFAVVFPRSVPAE